MAPVLSAHPHAMATLVLLLSVLSLAAGGKLLVVLFNGSRWLSMWAVLDGSVQKGHELVVVAPEINLYIKPTKYYFMKIHPVLFTEEDMDGNFQAFSEHMLKEGSFVERVFRFYEQAKITSHVYLSTCAHLLSNKELLRYLAESTSDAVLSDPMIPSGQILADHLSVPSKFLCTKYRVV